MTAIPLNVVLQSVDKTDKDFKHMMKNLQGVDRELDKVSKSSKKSIGTTLKENWLAATAAIAGAVVAIRAITNVMSEAIASSSEFELNVKKLSIAVENSDTSWVGVKESVLGFADAMQKTTVYGNTETLKLLQLLMPYTNDVGKAMEGASIAMDMASAGLFDITTASKYVGMAMQGNVEMLGRYIGELRSSSNEQLKTMTATEKTAYALDLLKTKYGGMAEGEVTTFAGAQKQLNNAWSDFMRSIGAFITESPSVVASYNKATGAVNGLAEAMQKIREQQKILNEDEGFAASIQKTEEAFVGAGLGNFRELLQDVVNLGVEAGEGFFKKVFNVEDVEELPETVRTVIDEINTELEESSPSKAMLPNEAAITAAFETYMEKQNETVENSRMLWLSWYDEKTAMEQARILSETEQYKFLTDTKKKAEESFWGTAGKLRDQFSAGISGMFKDMVRGNLTVEESFKKLGLAMVDTLIDYGVQLVINKLLASAMQAAMIGETAAAMAAIGASAAGPAAAVSLATMGANAAPAMAGMAATHAMSAGLTAVPGLEDGGIVRGAGITLVGESGPEFLNLPKGASVIPLDRAGGGSNVSIEIVINNPFMSTEEQAQAVGAMIAQQVSSAIAEEEERI